MIELSKQDCERVSQFFPQLNCEWVNQRIWGTLAFTCQYDAQNGMLRFCEGDTSLSDSYEIVIDFRETDHGLPKTFETSGIIESYAEQSKIDLLELHMYSDNSCCLGIYPEDADKSAFGFLVDRVVPYFFWQSYLRVKGREPWEAYPHGNEGYIQKLKELAKDIEGKTDKLSRTNSSGVGAFRNTLCNCGSGKKYKKCHLHEDERLWTEIRLLYELEATVVGWLGANLGKHQVH